MQAEDFIYKELKLSETKEPTKTLVQRRTEGFWTGGNYITIQPGLLLVQKQSQTVLCHSQRQ